MEKGWIKLHRIFTEWEWYHESKMVHLFLHFLLTATKRNCEWRGVAVKKGQLITGRKELCKQTGMSEQSIRTCVQKLIETNEISVISTNSFSIITITKYDLYQSDKILINQPLTNDQPIINQQLTNDQPTTNQRSTNDQPTTNQRPTND